MANKDVKVSDIVNAIFNAVANTHDGATEKDGTPVKIGLGREDKEYKIKDRQVFDGFSIKIYGDKLYLKYETDAPYSKVAHKAYEAEIREYMANIITFIKKEFKNYSDRTLSLKSDGDAEMVLRPMSQIRSWIEAVQIFTIGNLKGLTLGTEQEDPNEFEGVKQMRKFLEKGTMDRLY